MTDGLRWNLLEKYGLIGIKAPLAPPSRYTGTGKEAAAWRAVEQETADWKALFMAAQQRIADLTSELVRTAGAAPSHNTPAVRAASLNWKRRQAVNRKCVQCTNTLPENCQIKMCPLCAHKNKVYCKKYQRRLALRRVSQEQPAQ